MTQERLTIIQIGFVIYNRVLTHDAMLHACQLATKREQEEKRGGGYQEPRGRSNVGAILRFFFGASLASFVLASAVVLGADADADE